MKLIIKLGKVVSSFALLILVACGPDEPGDVIPEVQDYSCIVLNMGNYSESNGSFTLYNASSGKLVQEIYSKVNSMKLGAIIESAVLYKQEMMLLCNNADKIVFTDALTFKDQNKTISLTVIPRYAAVYKDSYAYVSCWGKTNAQTGALITNPVIKKIDLQTKTVISSLTPSAKPEAVAILGDTLFVASAYGLDVFNVKLDTFITHIASQFTQAEAQQIVLDKNNQLWLSLGSYAGGNTCGFMVVDAQTLQITTQLPEAKLSFEGDMAISPAKDKIYFIYANGIVGGQSAEVPTSIYSLDVSNYQLSATPLITGVGFYGLGVDPHNGNIYTSNVNGFITNSMTYIYNPSGTKIAEFMSGVGSCRFVFK